MNIRPMTKEDYDEIFAMWQITTKRALSKADERCQIERYLDRNPGMSQVAVVDGKIVGTVDKTHIFCYQNNETGQNFWKDFGFKKREDVFVFSYDNQ